MNFIQKQVVGGLLAMAGVVLTIVGLFTNGVVLTLGLLSFFGGIALVGYNMYTVFSGKALNSMASDVGRLAKRMENEMERKGGRLFDDINDE